MSSRMDRMLPCPVRQQADEARQQVHDELLLIAANAEDAGACWAAAHH